MTTTRIRLKKYSPLQYGSQKNGKSSENWGFCTKLVSCFLSELWKVEETTFPPDDDNDFSVTIGHCCSHWLAICIKETPPSQTNLRWVTMLREGQRNPLFSCGGIFSDTPVTLKLFIKRLIIKTCMFGWETPARNLREKERWWGNPPRKHAHTHFLYVVLYLAQPLQQQ